MMRNRPLTGALLALAAAAAIGATWIISADRGETSGDAASLEGHHAEGDPGPNLSPGFIGALDEESAVGTVSRLEVLPDKTELGAFVETFIESTSSWKRTDPENGSGPRVEGYPHGTWVIAYPSGKTESGEFVLGTRSGVWRIFDIDGSLLSEGEYVRGLRHGRWKDRLPGQKNFDWFTYVDGELQL